MTTVFCTECHQQMANWLKNVITSTSFLECEILRFLGEQLQLSLQNKQEMVGLTLQELIRLSSETTGKALRPDNVSQVVNCLISKQLISEKRLGRTRFLQITEDGVCVLKLLN